MDNIEAAIMWRSYKKHNAAQLQILAELNDCSAEEMRDRLMQAGVGACELPRAARKKEDPVMEKRMEEQNTQMVETEEKAYCIPPAPHYAEKIPKVWRLEELTALLDRVFAEMCMDECWRYEADNDEVMGMYATISFVRFRKKLMDALTEQEAG